MWHISLFIVQIMMLCLFAAPQEAPRARNFCLTSHQLKCLTQLANTLLELERNVEDLATELGFLNCAGESTYSLKGTGWWPMSCNTSWTFSSML